MSNKPPVCRATTLEGSIAARAGDVTHACQDWPISRRNLDPAPARVVATAALSEPVEEREAPARERPAASVLGEHSEVDAVEFNGPVAERDKGARVQRPLDEVPPAQREAGPGAGPGEGARVGGGRPPARRSAVLRPTSELWRAASNLRKPPRGAFEAQDRQKFREDDF